MHIQGCSISLSRLSVASKGEAEGTFQPSVTGNFGDSLNGTASTYDRSGEQDPPNYQAITFQQDMPYATPPALCAPFPSADLRDGSTLLDSRDIYRIPANFNDFPDSEQTFPQEEHSFYSQNGVPVLYGTSAFGDPSLCRSNSTANG